MNRKHFSVTTINIWGEGDRENGFLKYLYGLYHIPERSVKINNAHGGDPEAQLRQMINYYSTYDYDERYALFDLDRGDKSVKKAKELAEASGVICIVSDKNLEMELLRIITDDTKKLKRAGASSKEAKKIFAELCNLKNIDAEVEWGKYFSKSILEKAKSNTNWLNELIDAIQLGNRA